MNIWSVNPYATCPEAVSIFDKWQEFVMWSDVVTGRRFAQAMGLPKDVEDDMLYLDSHRDLIDYFKGVSPHPPQAAIHNPNTRV